MQKNVPLSFSAIVMSVNLVKLDENVVKERFKLNLTMFDLYKFYVGITYVIFWKCGNFKMNIFYQLELI